LRFDERRECGHVSGLLVRRMPLAQMGCAIQALNTGAALLRR
jgi:hypothetical protein